MHWAAVYILKNGEKTTVREANLLCIGQSALFIKNLSKNENNFALCCASLKSFICLLLDYKIDKYLSLHSSSQQQGYIYIQSKVYFLLQFIHSFHL